MSDLEFITTVLRIAGENDQHEDLFWRTDGDYAPVTFWVKCNDLFWWGTADLEQLTPENVGVYEQCFADVKAAAPDDCCAEIYAGSLFCCRVRQLRPQGCCYPPNRALWPLFDACGPERETGMGNPYAPGEREERNALAVAEACTDVRTR